MGELLYDPYLLIHHRRWVSNLSHLYKTQALAKGYSWISTSWVPAHVWKEDDEGHIAAWFSVFVRRTLFWSMVKQYSVIYKDMPWDLISGKLGHTYPSHSQDKTLITWYGISVVSYRIRSHDTDMSHDVTDINNIYHLALCHDVAVIMPRSRTWTVSELTIFMR